MCIRDRPWAMAAVPCRPPSDVVSRERHYHIVLLYFAGASALLQAPAPHNREALMRLVRYGRLGAEKPGVIGADGKLRALASVIDDITPEVLTPASLKRLQKLDVARLPSVSGHPRLGCPLAGIGKMAVSYTHLT